MTITQKVAELKKLDQYKDVPASVINDLAKAQLATEAANELAAKSKTDLTEAKTAAKAALITAKEVSDEAATTAAEVLATAKAGKETAENFAVELTEKLSDLENNPAKANKRPVVIIDKKKYTVMIPKLEIPGVAVVTVADLRENKLEVPFKNKKLKLCTYLLEVNSGMLSVVPSKTL